MKIYRKKYCEYCGSEIIKRKNESINSYYKRKFCSLSCQHKWNTQHKSSEVKCDYCGKVFRIRNSRIRKHNFCSSDCYHRYNTQKNTKIVQCDWCGREFRKKISQIKKTKRNFCSRKCFGEWQSKFCIGENGYGWKGGTSTINNKIRSSKKYIQWKLNVYKRDNFTCQMCGDKRGGNLNVHHKKQLSEIIKENNIQTMYDALKCRELWDINNGITLCKKCHNTIMIKK